jgi:hypothetical protein
VAARLPAVEEGAGGAELALHRRCGVDLCVQS